MKLRRSICLSFLMQAPVPCVRSAIAVVAIGLLATGALAQNVWTRSGTNDWYGDVTNWSQGHFPQAGEDVVITNASVGVLLTNAAPASGWLSSLTVSNTATLIFSNWTTALSATNVTIKTNAIVTCAGPFLNAPAMSNRVYIVCSNLTLLAGGQIKVDQKGYQGGANSVGNGPGGGTANPGEGSGGAYGGFGGQCGGAPSGQNYPVGDPLAPLLPGSGGGANGAAVAGGHGGGAVRIDASGRVTVNGTISANGGNRIANQCGGGSGGGIYIICNTLAGTNGIVRANGGDGQAWGGNGAGGRIAVSYYPPAQSNVGPQSVLFSVLPSFATPNTVAIQADIGTVYFPDSSLLTEPINVSGQILLNGLSWSPGNLTISNNWIRFPQEGFRLTVTNDVRIIGGSTVGRLDVGGSVLTNFPFPTSGNALALNYRFFNATSPPVFSVGGNLMLTNAALLHVYSAATSGYGSLVDVTGDMVLGPGCWVYAWSHWTNGASPLFRVRSLVIPTNSGFNANGAGYAALISSDGLGPGGGVRFSNGGSYGGLGGGVTDATKTYGSSNAPTQAGSAAGSDGTLAGFGGGLVRVESRDTVRLDGTITAKGGYTGGGWAGGGSGGGIYLRCRRFAGSTNGVLTANGGNGQAGYGGGGGRIAVWRVADLSPGENGAVVVSNSVSGGTVGSPAARNGTIVWGLLPPPGTVFVIH